ncbi:MAG: type II secretion system F family protein, partial [Candidatus Saccharimonadales bacterium]
DSLEIHPNTFSLVYVNMVRAGEAGGILDKILNRLALQVEKDAEIKGKVKGAMVYPGVITVFTVIAFIFVMTGVVPRLGGIFEQFGGELPIYTRVMLKMSEFLINWGLLLLIAFMAGLFLFRKFTKTKEGKLWLHKILLRIPILNTLIIKVSLARFARTFSSLITAGVSILDCLRITANSINNVVIKNIILESAQEVKNGQPLSNTLLKYKILPPMLGQMTAVGEETGEIDVVLEKVAEFYEEEVERTVNNLTSIIEPLLIVALGSIVGIIMASVFGPLSSFSSVID